ncbi:MAG: translocation/assembly module TamB, partial [Candidatus Marinimicrobia bacterium]|nr:translocation/assembly module TamB [Candidatus Neomarinimicrobiota bacterium]
LDFNRIQGEIVYKDGFLTIPDTFYCELGETELRIEGQADLKGNTVDARAYFSALNAGLLATVFDIDTLVGNIDGFVEANGTLTSPDLRGWFRGKQFGLPNLKFEESMARFGLVDIRTQIYGDIFVEAINCQTTLIPEDIPLTSLIVRLEGDTIYVQTLKAVSENLDVEIKGTIAHYTDFNLGSIKLSRSGNVLQNIDPICFSIKRDSIDIDAVRFRLNEGTLTLSGQVVKGDVRTARLELANLSIDPINYYLKGSQGVGGTLEGMVAYRKDLNGPNYAYEINLYDGKLIKQTFKKINLMGQLNNERILIENLSVIDTDDGLLNGQGFLTCNLNTKDERPVLVSRDSLALTLNFKRFDLNIVNRYLLPNIAINGKMNGQVNIYHYLGEPKMNYDLAVSDPVFDKLTGKEMTLKGIYQNERFSITEATLNDQYGQTRGRGYLPCAIGFQPARFAVLKESPLSLNFSMKTTSLVFLTAYLNALEEVEGEINLALSISGTPANQIRSGNVAIKGTTINIEALENPITGVNGSAVMKDNILDIVSLTGYMKEPQSPTGAARLRKRLKTVTWDVLFPPKIAEDQPNLAIGGTIDFTQFFLPRYNINLKGEELYIRTILAEQEGVVTGTFSMTGRDTIVYEGNIEVEDFILRNEFASKEKVLEIRKKPKIYSIMNIQLAIPGSLELKNSQIDGELEGDMWITRSGDEPYRFSGNLDILSGKFFAYGWEFKVVRGTISFDPVEFNPTLDIEAEVDLASYGMTDTTASSSSESEIVTVHLTGYLDNPNLEFESVNYSQSDILMFLTRTQNVGSESFEQDQLSASAANVASMWFERQLERNVSRFSGLDDFELRTNGNLLSRRETDQWSVMLGRKIAPNLYVRYERTLSTEPNQQFGLEYRLNRNMSIGGDVDQDGYSINYRYKYRY